MIRTHTEMSQFTTFVDRYNYLRLRGSVGQETFGFDRYINQGFYRSTEWKRLRDQAILRDDGCDLGIPGREIHERILVHHMNPVKMGDIVEGNADILDLEYLVCVTHRTHNAIHYGDANLLAPEPIERTPRDHIPW